MPKMGGFLNGEPVTLLLVYVDAVRTYKVPGPTLVPRRRIHIEREDQILLDSNMRRLDIFSRRGDK